jgi:hypothetical protein
MTYDDRSYQLVLYDATTGKKIGTATVLDTHSLNVGDDIGGYRIVRVRPESTREVGQVDVVRISEDDNAPGKKVFVYRAGDQLGEGLIRRQREGVSIRFTSSIEKTSGS